MQPATLEITTTALPPSAIASEEAGAIKAPMIGGDVLYVLPDGHSRGDARPAKVVRVCSATLVNLQVFTDGLNDFPAGSTGSNGIFWATSVPYADAEARMPGTWHWRA